jgi:hypothetical protein
MTKYTLFSLLAASNAEPVTINGIKGYVSAIQREDGSGRCFNVTLNTSKGKQTVFVRTVD